MGKNKRKEPNKTGKLKVEIKKIKKEMVNGYIEKYKDNYNREPSQSEINEMWKRAEKVVNRNIRRFGVKATTAVVLSVGIVIGGVFWFNNNEKKHYQKGKNKKRLLMKKSKINYLLKKSLEKNNMYQL